MYQEECVLYGFDGKTLPRKMNIWYGNFSRANADTERARFYSAPLSLSFFSSACIKFVDAGNVVQEPELYKRERTFACSVNPDVAKIIYEHKRICVIRCMAFSPEMAIRFHFYRISINEREKQSKWVQITRNQLHRVVSVSTRKPFHYKKPQICRPIYW